MMSLQQLWERMQACGATQIYAKILSPNDNSKNQIYLGGNFSSLSILPHGDIISDTSEIASAIRDRAKSKLDFFWLGEESLILAPDAQLILYPKYPEIRLSGLLRGTLGQAPSKLLASRDPRRVLFFGICPDNKILGFCTSEETGIAKEFYSLVSNVSTELPLLLNLLEIEGFEKETSQEKLLRTLKEIALKNWIPSQKLNTSGIKEPYKAQNGGGYTLEAEFGIIPNGIAEPDIYGWELKQYGVDSKSFRPKSPVTLMTPEPTGGVYVDHGVKVFLDRYGYSDRNTVGRVNFGGIHKVGEICKKTNLYLSLSGYKNGKITDWNGGIHLILPQAEEIVASWSYANILEHWSRKHAQVAYIPSIKNQIQNFPHYAYGSPIQIAKETDPLYFLNAVEKGLIYYDPGIKGEFGKNGHFQIKRRSQFRIRHKDLRCLYESFEDKVLLKDFTWPKPPTDTES